MNVWTSRKGQAELEFMLILPFFLAVVFGLLMLVVLVFKGEMLTYATYMAARVASVKHPVLGNAKGEAEKAARQIMPGVDISINYFPVPGTPGLPLGSRPLIFNPTSKSGTMVVTGSYRLNPLVRVKKNSSLDSGMPTTAQTITARVPMHHFQSPRATSEFLWKLKEENVAEDDNVYALTK